MTVVENDGCSKMAVLQNAQPAIPYRDSFLQTICQVEFVYGFKETVILNPNHFVKQPFWITVILEEQTDDIYAINV